MQFGRTSLMHESLTCEEAFGRCRAVPTSTQYHTPNLSQVSITMSHRPYHKSRGAVDEKPSSKHHRSRSCSPHRTHHHKRKRSRSPAPAPLLPFQAQRLTKHDFASCKPMFALYLDIQKQLVLEDLEADEVKGRWKSFVGKW